MKKVLVLMATYNGEKYLEKQIDSILNQKNIDVSLLIRDDGSTDNTKKIIQRKMKLESKISLLEADAEDSHGAMINYYKLLCIAQTTESMKYDFFALSDQDDVWLPNKLAIMSKRFKNSNKPELVYANYSVIDSNDVKVVNNVANEIGLDYENPIVLLFNNSFAWGHSIMFNAMLLKSVSINEAIAKSNFPHDAYLAKYAVLCDGLMYEPEVLVNYRRHSENVSSIWYKLSVKLIQKKLDFAREGKIYANLINANFLLFQENKNSRFIDSSIIDTYNKGLSTRGISTFIYFRKNKIYRKQKSRDFNMKLTYALGIYAKWVGKSRKMVNI